MLGAYIAGPLLLMGLGDAIAMAGVTKGTIAFSTVLAGTTGVGAVAEEIAQCGADDVGCAVGRDLATAAVTGGVFLGAKAMATMPPPTRAPRPAVAGMVKLGGAGGSLREFSSVATRTTRGGGQGVRLTRPDGSVIDITRGRVKEFVPNTHPNAPPGKLQRIRFENAQPGSKGFKRDPTPDDLRLLEEAFR